MWNFCAILLAFLVFIAVSKSGESFLDSSSSLKVCFSDGCVRGRAVDGNIKSYDAFYGIPYAAPPVKELRFKKPVPVSKWRSTKDATTPRQSCVQTNILTGAIEGTEDCLRLNVFRPDREARRRSEKPLPVFVLLHASSFKWGSAHPKYYAPDYLLDSGEVVVVAVQYRLGVFGFLASGDESCKGNFGLKDQVLALQWVRKNIREFGGDPHSVTVIGSDAGAMSAHLLMMSKQANGLFHKAILMDGTALSPWALLKEPKPQFQQFAAIAGVSRAYSKDPAEIIDELRDISAYELQKYCANMYQSIHRFFPIFRPTIEGDWGSAIIREDPSYVWESGNFQHRPFLLFNEGYEQGIFADLYYNTTQRREFLANWEYDLSTFTDIPREAMQPIRDYYFGGEPTDENFVNVLVALSDILFYYPVYKTAEYYTQYADVRKNPVDFFLFNYTSSFSFSALFNTNVNLEAGAGHSDSLLYLFRWGVFDPLFRRGAADAKASKFLVKYLINYAKSGVKYSEEVRRCTAEQMDGSFCDFLYLARKEPNGISVTYDNGFDLGSVAALNEVQTIASKL